MFSWNNREEADAPRLEIQSNDFIPWALKDQGLDWKITANFQRYASDKLTPFFSEDFSQVTFSFQRGDNDPDNNVKISRGEESSFVWSVFQVILSQVVETLNTVEEEERDTDRFNELQYIFIDDPVSSLDENHLIQLAVDIADTIKESNSDLKFIITTHNPLFYNVLHNALRKAPRYLLEKIEDGSHSLSVQNHDSPFAYHLFLKQELELAISTGQIRKFHFNFLRNLLEKTATFLGYDRWAAVLPDDGRPQLYESRMINLFSHSKHSGEEVAELNDDDKRVLSYLVGKVNGPYHFKSEPQPGPEMDDGS